MAIRNMGAIEKEIASKPRKETVVLAVRADESRMFSEAPKAKL